MKLYWAVLSDLVLLVQLCAAAAGLILYISSFFGNGIEEAVPFFAPAFVCLAPACIALTFRDRRFFLKEWRIGLLGLRLYFPFQFFPARRQTWLNPLGWIFMAVLLLHFVLLANASPVHGMTEANTSAELRYVALILTSVGTLTALGWLCPPTEKPQDDES